MQKCETRKFLSCYIIDFTKMGWNVLPKGHLPKYIPASSLQLIELTAVIFAGSGCVRFIMLQMFISVALTYDFICYHAYIDNKNKTSRFGRKNGLSWVDTKSRNLLSVNQD